MKSFLKTLALFCIALATGCITYLLMAGAGEVGMASYYQMSLALPGTEGNPDARVEWEWMRLRDPETMQVPEGIREAELAFARTLPTRGAALFKSAGVGEIDWEHRGPYNIGGRTRALAMDVTDSRVLLAGGVTGGMWRSTDFGENWQRTTRPDQLPSLTCIVQDTRPGREHVWYYGTGELRTNSERFGNAVYSGDGVFKSVDSGKTWSRLESTVVNTPHVLDQPFDYIWKLVADDTDLESDVLYAAAYGGVYRSTDGGEMWSAVLGGFSHGVTFTDVAMTQGGVLYAVLSSDGDTKGIWRSEDGVEWTEITPEGWPTVYRRTGIAIVPGGQEEVYFLSEAQGTEYRIEGFYGFDEWYSLWNYRFLGEDGTGTNGVWRELSGNLPLLGPRGNYNSLNSYALFIAVNPYNIDEVFIGGSNLYRSTDGFSTSGNVRWLGGYNVEGGYGDPGALHPDQHTILFSPDQQYSVIVGNDGGVYRTEDYRKAWPVWEPMNNGYYTTQFYTVAIDPETEGSRLVTGGMQDNGVSLESSGNGTAPWAELWGGDGSFCAVTNGGRTVYVSSQVGNLVRLELDGENVPVEWTRVRPPVNSGYLFINPFALDPSDRNRMYMPAGEYLWYNYDLRDFEIVGNLPVASAWLRLDNTRMPGAAISAVGVSTSNPARRVYYGTSDGRLRRLDFESDETPEPVDVTGSAFPERAYINCVAVDPADGNNALVVFSSYNTSSLFYTRDGGETWEDAGGNLEEYPDGTGSGPSCRWAAFYHGEGGSMFFVGTSTGLYSTGELAGDLTVWEQEGANTIGNVIVDMIKVRQSDGFVAVGTWGNGVFSADIRGTTGVDGDNSPVSLLLEQNVPNPFRNHTTISFETVRQGAVTLTVYDVRGRALATPVDGFLPAGRHSVVVDLRQSVQPQSTGGTLYYELKIGKDRVTRKMVRIE